jgi:hypothetical protein
MPTHFIHGELGILVAFLQRHLVVLQESANHHHVICTSHKISNSVTKLQVLFFYLLHFGVTSQPTQKVW